jgi:hypothetical protein
MMGLADPLEVERPANSMSIPDPDAAGGTTQPPALPKPKRAVNDDVAYFLPMLVFLAFTWAGGHWETFFVTSYVFKTVLTAILLILFWKHYTKITWSFWWLGIILGIVGVFQWVGMERLLLHYWPNYPRLSGTVFDPTHAFTSPAQMWAFIAVRWAGAALVVPVMEELFWRDYLWRTVVAPADFKLAKRGQWESGVPLMIVTLAFCSVHLGEWMTAITWGLMVGLLLVFTRSLGACIIMHGVTNFLLGAYVLFTHDWKFW